ncbi:MAG TPA: hypothetical protein V6D29_16665 [Leptolyngbyaceae cyanobacterium]
MSCDLVSSCDRNPLQCRKKGTEAPSKLISDLTPSYSTSLAAEQLHLAARNSAGYGLDTAHQHLIVHYHCPLSRELRDQPGAIASQPQPLPPPHPLFRFEQLQAIADNDWRLSTKELATLLGLQSLSTRQFERYSFRFARAGRNGALSAWKVEKM